MVTTPCHLELRSTSSQYWHNCPAISPIFTPIRRSAPESWENRFSDELDVFPPAFPTSSSNIAATAEVFTSCWPLPQLTSRPPRSLSRSRTSAHGSGFSCTTTRASRTGRTALPTGSGRISAGGGARSASSVLRSAACVAVATTAKPTASQAQLRIDPPHATQPSRVAENQQPRIASGSYPSQNTPSSFPLGSRKWNRRPPGKLKMGRVMVPPAARTLASMASRS
ncbi:MAG: hypothetical protein JWR43_702 [Phenylobacterium sp.]|nr:hypothetical protein [Phenylobacterium sp.]